jgi:tetratricopeptide (TPR) repeat protein
MIVRDEAELLPRFLDHARGLWDELVVVDTGSKDGTVSILEQAGARVLHRPWADDFAAARNAGLAEARGDWILYLDADEMVSPALVVSARALLDDQTAGAATVLMRNPMPHGHQRRARLLRMFRSDPAIRFHHAIHEEVETAVRAALARTGQRRAALAGDVLHLGYVRGRAAARNKKERDLQLLQRCVAEDAADFYSWFKMLELARFWSDGVLAAETAAACHQALAQAGAKALAGQPFAGELCALVARSLHPWDPAAALGLLERWAPRVPPSAALTLARGELRERLGQPERAAAEFRACLALGEVTSDEQQATVRPRMGLCRLAMAAGDLPAAQVEAEAALAQAPCDPEALLAAIVIARARGGEAAVSELSAAHRARLGPSLELDEALGDEALLAGRPEEAARHLRRAAGDPPEGPAALRLAQALLADGQVDPARELALALLSGLPEAGLGVLLCDLVSDRDTALELDLEPAAASAAFRSWVDALFCGPHHELRACLERNVAAVAPLFPWLPGHLAARAGTAR